MPRNTEERLAILEERFIQVFDFIKDSNEWFKRHEAEDDKRHHELMQKIDELKENIAEKYVTKEMLEAQYWRVKTFLKSLISVILLAVVWAILALIIK